MTYDDIIIGGGFYGALIAEASASKGARVLLLESTDRLMGAASHNNQARVHGGYHYPRNFSTARRSQSNLERFIADFAPAITTDFEAIYAIARRGSKVSAENFAQTMKAVGARLEVAPAASRRLFAPNSVEAVFRVNEPVFDANVIRNLMAERLDRAGVVVRLNTAARAVKEGPAVHTPAGTLKATRVFLCAYAHLNEILRASRLPEIELQHEWTEICLIKVPTPLARRGLTVMDGDFFSILPFPGRDCHSLTHVTYTPHARWRGSHPPDLARASRYSLMIKDAVRLVPALVDARYKESLWQVKTILPRNERNDGRPILAKVDHGVRGLIVILGAKIDSAYDILDQLEPATLRVHS